ncbi:MAG: IS3 family transposase [Gammaproteobacteria bacterium]|nr:IS3 family transposase [Gammaproteobacteria bacterium]
MVSLPERRRAAEYLQKTFGVSERKACRVLAIHRSTHRHRGSRQLPYAATKEVVRLSYRHPCWGYRKIYDLLDRCRYPVGREKVRLIRATEGLQVPKKTRKRKALGCSTHLANKATRPYQVWSWDFIHDQSLDGRSLRCLVVVDEFTRECLAIECGRSMTSRDVITVLVRLKKAHGTPDYIRSDNGPEFVARSLKNWMQSKAIGSHYIEPGSPWQNAYAESFNSILRSTCLNRWAFESVGEAQAVIEQWRGEYTAIRLHGSLGGRSPAQFKTDWADNRLQPSSAAARKS